VQFVTIFGLLVGLLAVVPYVAHRLRRKKSEPLFFAPAEFVSKTLPKARKRSDLEDKALYALRTIGVVLLALLAATPLVRCNRVTLARKGASLAVAVVLDDSMSMRARVKGSATQFSEAKLAARDLLASLQEGDSVSIVLAGSPVRVALGPTTVLETAQTLLESLQESDRGTDLEGALKTAESLLAKQAQGDKRIVLLSDRADGHPESSAIHSELPLWAPLQVTEKSAADCAMMRADRSGDTVAVHVVCNEQAALQGRKFEVRQRTKELKAAPLLGSSLGVPSKTTTEAGKVMFVYEDVIKIPVDAPNDLVASLSDSALDAIASDDSASVLSDVPPGSLLLVGASRDEGVVTGGAPLVERALRALKVPAPLVPLPALPDTSEDLAPYVGIVLDDPSGLTPEQRRALMAFVQRGGFVFLGLGISAGRPPLGASFETFLKRAPTWTPKNPTSANVNGVDQAKASLLGESAPSALDLHPQGRIQFAEEPEAQTLLQWSDGAPLLLKRAVGKGEVWILGLPFAVDASDLPLRPAFLAILDTFTREALGRVMLARTEVGTAWTFRASKPSAVSGAGPAGERLSLEGEGDRNVNSNANATRYAPSTLGQYSFVVDGKSETKIAAPILRELEMHARKVEETESESSASAARPNTDLSRALAFGLLVLFIVELLVRVFFQRRAEAS
jgi:von Willebrand factor type A domain/Aerotolerance regulator N-terminal